MLELQFPFPVISVVLLLLRLLFLVDPGLGKVAADDLVDCLEPVQLHLLQNGPSRLKSYDLVLRLLLPALPEHHLHQLVLLLQRHPGPQSL